MLVFISPVHYPPHYSIRPKPFGSASQSIKIFLTIIILITKALIHIPSIGWDHPILQNTTTHDTYAVTYHPLLLIEIKPSLDTLRTTIIRHVN